MGEINSRPNAIKWNELENYVDRPVYDGDTWYILHGYKQYGKHREIMLSDNKGAIPFENLTLYPTDEGFKSNDGNAGSKGEVFGENVHDGIGFGRLDNYKTYKR
jgi:hypothetical protein